MHINETQLKRLVELYSQFHAALDPSDSAVIKAEKEFNEMANAIQSGTLPAAPNYILRSRAMQNCEAYLRNDRGSWIVIPEVMKRILPKDIPAKLGHEIAVEGVATELGVGGVLAVPGVGTLYFEDSWHWPQPVVGKRVRVNAILQRWDDAPITEPGTILYRLIGPKWVLIP